MDNRTVTLGNRYPSWNIEVLMSTQCYWLLKLLSGLFRLFTRQRTIVYFRCTSMLCGHYARLLISKNRVKTRLQILNVPSISLNRLNDFVRKIEIWIKIEKLRKLIAAFKGADLVGTSKKINYLGFFLATH